MKTKLIKEVRVRPGSHLENGAPIEGVTVERRLYENENSRNVGGYIVRGANYASPFFDSIPDALEHIRENFEETAER